MKKLIPLLVLLCGGVVFAATQAGKSAEIVDVSVVPGYMERNSEEMMDGGAAQGEVCEICGVALVNGKCPKCGMKRDAAYCPRKRGGGYHGGVERYQMFSSGDKFFKFDKATGDVWLLDAKIRYAWVKLEIPDVAAKSSAENRHNIEMLSEVVIPANPPMRRAFSDG